MITLTWADSEQKVLEWTFGQRWSNMDFLMACQKSQRMLKSIDHPVNILVDLSKSKFYPTNLIYLTHTGIRMRAKNTDKIIVVTESKLWSRLYQHFIQIYPMDALPIEFISAEEKSAQRLRLFGDNGKLVTV